MNKVQKKYKYLVIDDKYYQAECINGETVFKQVPNKTVKATEAKAKKMIEKLKKGLDKEKVLMESIMKLDEQDFQALYKVLFKSKKQYKPKTREHHCVDVKVGNFVLPIVD